MSNRKGFTLIELILSIGLLGLIAVSMLGAFETGLFNISKAGSRTRNVSEAEYVFLDSEKDVIIEETLVILLPKPNGGTQEISVSGSYHQAEGNIDTGSYGNTSVIIKAFVPVNADLTSTD